VVMAVLIVCLVGALRWRSGLGAKAVSLGGACRSSCWLWVLDMVCLSVICLQVNHAESLYWVLVAAFVGTLAWSMGGSAASAGLAGSLRPCARSMVLEGRSEVVMWWAWGSGCSRCCCTRWLRGPDCRRCGSVVCCTLGWANLSLGVGVCQ